MSGNSNNVLWRFANAEVDTRARDLRVNGQPVPLEPKPFDVLVLLLEHAGELLTFEELLEAAWTGRVTSEATVINTVFKIRKALGDDDQSLIKTIPKTGYRLVSAVERVPLESAPLTLPELTVGSDVPGREQWRLEERLGSGGYGDAWLALHKKTGQKRVFKFCLEADKLSAFKREVTLNRLLRQALPERHGIAKILEWNFEQAPYFIESEYAGDNLRLWAQKRGGLQAVPLELRLDLIGRVAAEVAAAHSVGVLHKDLKPENILIAEDAGALAVRLCDFGIGRLLDADKLGQHGITQLGFTQTVATDPNKSGTLLYLAPELLSSGTPSIQSDVYALGVLLYQVVTGKFGEPMAHGWEASVADEVLRQDIADATQGDRNKRMASAQILADRLARLAERRTELSRQQEARQQAERSAAALERARVRRPWLIAAAVTLIAGLISSLYMAAQARHQARLANALTSFIADDVLNGDDAYSSATPETSMRNAILRALPLAGKRFAGEPASEATMDATLAQALRRMTDYSNALALDQRTASLDRDQYGSNDSRTLAALVNVAADLHALNKDDEARTQLNAILPGLKAALPATDPQLFYARKLEAQLICNNVDWCEPSLSLYSKLIGDIETTKGNDALLNAVRVDYAEELFDSGRPAESEKLLRQWLPQVQEHYGSSGYQTLQFHGMLGDALLLEHRFAEAEVELSAQLDGMAKLVDPENRTMIDDMRHLADAYGGQDKWQQALDLRMQAYRLAEKHFGANIAHDEIGADIAEADDELKRRDEALDWAQSTVSAMRQTLPAQDPRYLHARFWEAKALLHLGRLPEAHKVVDELKPLIPVLIHGDLDAQSAFLYLQAELADAEHDFPTARDLLTRTIKLDQQAWGADDFRTHNASALLQSIPSV